MVLGFVGRRLWTHLLESASLSIGLSVLSCFRSRSSSSSSLSLQEGGSVEDLRRRPRLLLSAVLSPRRRGLFVPDAAPGATFQ